MESGRYFLIVLLFTLVGVFAYSQGWITDSQVNRSNEDSAQQKISQELSEFTLNETIGEEEVWRIQSPRASRSGSMVQLKSPRIVQSVDGDSKAVVQSDSGVYNLDRKIIVLTSDVILKRPQQNQVLLTEKLKWDRSKQLVTTDVRVELKFPRGVLHATGMRMDLKEDTVQFLSDVRYTSH